MRDEERPPPAYVEIEPAGGAFFLLHLDERGECLADTWHPTVEEAKAQAGFELEVEEDDWESVPS